MQLVLNLCVTGCMGEDVAITELLLFQVSQAHTIIGSQNIYNLYAPCYRGPDSNYANLTNFNMAAMLMPKVYENELQVGVN